MPIPQHETQIIQLIRGKDKSGVSLLYDHYSGAVYGMVTRIVQQPEIAKEVLQDAFVKAWKNFDKYDESKGRLFTWLAQIARNTALSKVRSGKFVRSQKTDSLDDDVYNNDERLTEEMTTEDFGLNKVIDGLDDKYKTLIDYIYYRGYSQREAAEALNLPVGTVKTRIRHAILELRKTLGNEAPIVLALLCSLKEV